MLTTLALVKRELMQTDSDIVLDADAEAFIIEKIDVINDRVFEHTKRDFLPRVATEYYDAVAIQNGGLVDGNTLWLSRPLLSLTEVTIDDAAQSLANEIVTLPKGDKMVFRLHKSSGASWLSPNTREESISVTGVWAYRDPPSEGWRSTGDALAANLNASTPAFTVDDVAGFNDRFQTPRFSPGLLVRIGSEYMQVKRVDADTNTVSVVRGIRGTTKAEHVQGTAIDYWLPQESIVYGATRWAGQMYMMRAQYQTKKAEGMAEVTYAAIPDDFRGTLDSYIKPGRIFSS